MMMIYVLTLPWFLLVGLWYMDSLPADELPSPIAMTALVMLWPITAAILAGVQLADFFNKKKND